MKAQSSPTRSGSTVYKTSGRRPRIDPTVGLSHLERLRRPPRQPTIDGLVGALHRLGEIKALAGDHLDTSQLPSGRLRQLAAEGLNGVS